MTAHSAFLLGVKHQLWASKAGAITGPHLCSFRRVNGKRQGAVVNHGFTSRLYLVSWISFDLFKSNLIKNCLRDARGAAPWAAPEPQAQLAGS